MLSACCVTSLSVSLMVAQSIKMPEEEVLYSNVRFIKAKRETNERASPVGNPTFSQVNISRTQPSTTEVPELPQQAELSRHSKLLSERVVLLVVIALLAAAVIALCVTSFKQGHHREGRNKQKDQPSYKCEDGWEKHKGKCYYFSIAKTSRNESRDECGAKKGDLVKINSKEEQEFLESKVKGTNNSDDKFWIELIYLAKNNTWVWRDGSPLNTSLTFWKNKDQDLKNGTKGANPDEQSCLRLEAKGGAKLLSCKTRHRSICEKQTVTEHCKCATV
ncbi:killer cell lectin-like receptor subfamily B member 1B allele B isoform X2 [Simochromis diagramma]|uniref:killer cell lectin-like receptor subfamily B member 1B allele B isoform X2 n=1 Tax=Simochromis diagramma TaxID=43689 RepID=UPI001A7EDD7A|nr:killer cell lectin-like receptor subfamily B member 1B allele B isoform X2 [Simochromis diagramma]